MESDDVVPLAGRCLPFHLQNSFKTLKLRHIHVKYNQHTYRHEKYKPYRPGGPQQIGAASVVVCTETTLQPTVCALLLT